MGRNQKGKLISVTKAKVTKTSLRAVEWAKVDACFYNTHFSGRDEGHTFSSDISYKKRTNLKPCDSPQHTLLIAYKAQLLFTRSLHPLLLAF